MRTMKWLQMFGVLALVATGCTQAEDRETPQGNDELGIVEYRTTETEAGVRIVGVDAAGAEVATVDLRAGKIELMDTAGLVDGVEVDFKVGDRSWSYQGHVGWTASVPGEPALEALGRDPYITSVLRQHAFEWRTEPVVAEVPLGCAMGGPPYPQCSGAGSMLYGTEYPGNGLAYQKAVCNNANKTHVERICSYPAGASTPCGTVGFYSCVVCSTFTVVAGSNYPPPGCVGGMIKWMY